MTSNNGGMSVCGHCRFYSLTGRRGGECGQFGVPVKASWTACPLAQSPFEVGRSGSRPVAEVLGEAVCGAISAPRPEAKLPSVSSPSVNPSSVNPPTVKPHLEPATPVVSPVLD